MTHKVCVSKKCPESGKLQPVSKFYKRRKSAGFSNRCILCERHKSLLSYYRRTINKERSKARLKEIETRYGIDTRQV